MEVWHEEGSISGYYTSRVLCQSIDCPPQEVWNCASWSHHYSAQVGVTLEGQEQGDLMHQVLKTAHVCFIPLSHDSTRYPSDIPSQAH